MGSSDTQDVSENVWVLMVKMRLKYHNVLRKWEVMVTSHREFGNVFKNSCIGISSEIHQALSPLHWRSSSEASFISKAPTK